MKKITLFIATIIFASITAQGQSGYKIKGTITGVADTTCILAYYLGESARVKDTVNIDSNGSFVFEGNEPLKGGIYMIYLSEGKYVDIIVSEQRVPSLILLLKSFRLAEEILFSALKLTINLFNKFT